jgi:hypothetical protein
VILSVPFKRLTRVLLGEPVFGCLRRHADVVVVSPFSNEREFQAEFGGSGIRFVQWRPPDPIGQPLRALFAVSELLRIRGYWRRFRKQRMAWNMANGYVTLGPNGEDRKLPAATRLVLFVTSVLGLWAGAWKTLDALIGPKLFDCAELRELTRGYRRVTLIQSASFGIQDRMLAWMGRRERWRTVLVPYTTDQLLYNGYLMFAFDAVCVQGPVERRFAAELHGIPPARIVQLGSAWFRHMDIIARALRQGRRVPRTDRPVTIMFAGVSTTYFPRVSERVLLEELMRAVEEQRLPGVRVIYRPVVADDEERREIEEAWGRTPRLRLQFPQPSCLAMDEYGRGRMDAELSEYVSQLLDVDLVVTAGVTSLTIDAANLGIPAISAIADGTGVLRRRRNELLYDPNGRFNDLEALPIAHQVDQLVPLIKQMLADSAGAATIAAELAAGWDYREMDFSATLLAAVMG